MNQGKRLKILILAAAVLLVLNIVKAVLTAEKKEAGFGAGQGLVIDFPDIPGKDMKKVHRDIFWEQKNVYEKKRAATEKNLAKPEVVRIPVSEETGDDEIKLLGVVLRDGMKYAFVAEGGRVFTLCSQGCSDNRFRVISIMPEKVEVVDLKTNMAKTFMLRRR
ncbi:MAG: hypothetical protein ACLFP1_03365 [Candidatus Goldiibacteriota bacterium]